MWRVVLEGVATLHEIETHWSLADLYDANFALDMKIKAQKEASEEARRNG